MTEPTIKQILDSWFDDGRVPFHRENARFWEDSAGATIVMLCDRLDAAEQSHEAYVRLTTEQFRSQRERLVAAQERIAELEAENERLKKHVWLLQYDDGGKCVTAISPELRSIIESPPLTDAELANEIVGSEP